jgi:putative nucleotidyltransferase with HDIG domain
MRAVTATSALPSAPSIHRRIDDAIADPAATARDLGAILAEDPALGAKVLQLANSSMFHSGPGVTSVSKAASYLGVNTLKLLARSGCRFPLDPRCSPAGFSIERFQRHSLLVAHIAQRIADEAHLPCDAFTAGLLHDVGKLVAAARSLPAASKHSASHAAAGACLLGLWGLPDALVEAVAHHHDPEQISSRGLTGAAVIHVADALAHELAPVPGEHGPAINGDYLASIGVADRVPAWRALAAA